MHVYSFFAKLRTRQMTMVAVILVPSLVMLVMQAFQDRKQAEENLALQARMIAVQIRMYSKEVLPDPEMYLSQLAILPELFQGKKECNQFMQVSLRADFFFHNLFVVAPNGDLTCSGVPLTESVNVSNRSYFHRVMQTKKFAIGDFQITRKDKAPVIVFALPILDSTGNVKAVIGASAKLTWLQEAFSRAIASTSNAAIAASAIDESGMVIASAPDRNYAGQPAHDWSDAVRESAKAGTPVRSEIWRNGTARTTAYLPMYRSSSANIYLRVGVPQEEAIALVAKNTWQRVMFLVTFALAAALAAWLVGSWLVVKPIRRLKETAVMLGNGRLNARTGVKRSDGEIGQLALHFDMMAERLEAQHNTLSQLTRIQALRGEVNAAVLRAKDEKTLLDDVCDIVRKIGNFEFSWVGYVDHDNPSNLIRRAWSAADPQTGKNVTNARWSVEAIRHDPAFAAVTSGEVRVIRDISKSSPNTVWSKAVIKLGCEAAVGLPILAANQIIGGLAIYSADASAFDDAQVKMLIETANDLGFGIAALRAENRQRETRDLLRMIVDNIPTMIFVKSARDFKYVSMNRTGEKLTGLTESDFIGSTDFDLFPKSLAEYFREMDHAALIAEQDLVITDESFPAVHGDVRLMETKKLRLLGKDGIPKYLLGISEDVTDRRQAEERLNYLATHDHLTGLMNRHGLLLRFSDDWPQAVAGTCFLTVLYIDLDGFKEINDTLGHPVGDELLKMVANLLREGVHEGQIVARVGGDEFIILLRDKQTPENAVLLAECIRARCEKPFYVEGREIFISASIGISAYPGPVESHEALLRTADIAMYHAKAQGRNRYAVYSPDMHSGAVNRLEMRNYLRHAIEFGELTIHYQPRVSIATGRIIGAEALLRWCSKPLGAISPAIFIPLAEESGLITQIGEWVLRHACLQAREWQSVGSDPIHVAVNLSPRQLRQAGLIEVIRNALVDSDLEPALLELEVTESAVMDQGSKPIDILTEISDLGIRLAVDDFGTGYSNLGYLKQLPLDVLKVDQSFVRGITNSASELALVTAIVSMAKSLSLSVTAEGIETTDQLEIMRRLGVADYQGFYFSKAVPAEEFATLLTQQNLSHRRAT